MDAANKQQPFSYEFSVGQGGILLRRQVKSLAGGSFGLLGQVNSEALPESFTPDVYQTEINICRALFFDGVGLRAREVRPIGRWRRSLSCRSRRPT